MSAPVVRDVPTEESHHGPTWPMQQAPSAVAGFVDVKSIIKKFLEGEVAQKEIFWRDWGVRYQREWNLGDAIHAETYAGIGAARIDILKANHQRS